MDKGMKEVITDCWWVVLHSDGYTIGSKHISLDGARWYLENCIDKERRRFCRVVREEIHRIYTT